MNLLLALLLNSLALVFTAYLVPGFQVDSPQTALLAAIVLGIVNTFIRPILLFLTAPFNFLTLGLFTFVVNAIMLLLTAWVVKGLVIDGLVSAILGAIVLSVVSTIMSMLAHDLSFVGNTGSRKKK